MSRILDKLQEAEEQRQRVIAERKRLELDADQALSAHERHVGPYLQADFPPQATPVSAPLRPARHFPWAWASVAAAFLAAAIVMLPKAPDLAGKAPSTAKTPPTAEPAPVASEARTQAVLKLDRDLEAFAARVRALEKP